MQHNIFATMQTAPARPSYFPATSSTHPDPAAAQAVATHLALRWGGGGIHGGELSQLSQCFRGV